MNFTTQIRKVLRRVGNTLVNPTAIVMLGVAGWYVGLGVFPGAEIAYAQNTNATIRGQVLDPTGALVPEAQVVIVNTNTNVTVFAGKSDSAGAFVAPQVIPGSYKITVSSPGLKDAVVDLVATVAQVASVDIHMQIGSS